jgi:hypothetical protein
MILATGRGLLPDYGMGRSRGTLPFQLAGNIKRGGLVEKAFGLTLRELLYDYGGGSASGRPIRAVQVGGPLGATCPAAKFDVPLDYEAFAAIGGMLGHGGMVVFDDTVDMAQMARYAMEFCAVESCGKCTPCRIGSTRGVEVIDRIRAATQRAKNLTLLRDLCDTMIHGSLCAMGGMTPRARAQRARPLSPKTFALSRAEEAIACTPSKSPTPARPSHHRLLVTLEIDGTAVTVPRGHVGDARRGRRGVRVPKLCATDSLEAFGSCRLCLVEIEGRKGYPASCTTPVEAGMKVRTQTTRWRSCAAG